MKNNTRIAFLLASFIWTVVGFIYFEPSSETVMSLLSFVVALLFLYTYLGSKQIVCSFSDISVVSKSVVIGSSEDGLNKDNRIQAQLLTVGVVLLLLVIGFGFGRALYHLIH